MDRLVIDRFVLRKRDQRGLPPAAARPPTFAED
jgi:hypothetical protein